ncbi:MAG: DUF3892 domain-containing protein [Parvibaculum sp.]|uniref:DUF3892 domain-containing protein n=1 Tax=Parvibaculum sp. TaxID=2024848 RepID=UPI0032ECE3E0
MANTAEIKCINKDDRYDPYERITHVGGYVTKQWKLTLNEAINYIETGEWSFYVSVGGKSVWVIVASRNGRKYLKTEADGDAPNNLLSLPECP